jgi:hypothetical protein
MITNENVRSFIEHQFQEQSQNTSRYLEEPLKERFPLVMNDYKERILNGRELPHSLYTDLSQFYGLVSLFHQLLGSVFISTDCFLKDEEVFWYMEQPFMKALLDLNQHNSNRTTNTYLDFCGNVFSRVSSLPYEKARKVLSDLGFTDKLILDIISHLSSWQLNLINSQHGEEKESFIGQFLLSGQQGGFTLLKRSKENYLTELIQNKIKKDTGFDANFIRFLLKHDSTHILEHAKFLFTIKDWNNSAQRKLVEGNLEVLRTNQWDQFAILCDKLMHLPELIIKDKLTVAIFLEQSSNSQKKVIQQLIWDYFEEAKQLQYSWYIQDQLGDWRTGISVYSFSLRFMRANFPEEVRKLRDTIVNELQVFTVKIPLALKAEFGADAILDIIAYLKRKDAIRSEEVIIQGISLIMELDGWNNRSILHEIGTSTSNKRILQTVANAYLSLGDAVVDELKALLETANVSNRFLAAFALSKFDNPELKQHLLGFVDKEKNDDTRDTLIETLQEELYPSDFGFDDLLELIEKAGTRKKLGGIKEKGIELADLPALYWMNGNVLTEKELTFLFYRNARSKGLNSDLEARLLTQFIDKERASSFSRFILKLFQDQGAQAKQKHLMTLAALLGNDNTVPLFETLFKRMIDEKRVKVAEMVIHNTMVIGTNKALRLVEFISRKYANKKPALAEAARNSLEAAAKELNLSADELADLIIPNFDFEDLQRIVKVEEEEYRAMIDLDFSLVFYDENNKKRKSLPKNASKDIKDEMNAIAKDLKAVVRMQSGRMEQFLQVGKQWTTDYWMNLFMNHPIMFVYATKLLWIGETNEGEKVVFRVLEDALMVDIENEEVAVDTLDKIYLYHPILVEEEVRNTWKRVFYDEEISPLVEQVNRPFYFVQPSDIVHGEYKKLPSSEIPKGAEFVKSYLEKRGWSKETGDGGSLWFYKQFPTLDLSVQPFINGPCAFYMEGQNADIESINFFRISDHKKHQMEHVPQVLLSEILMDMYHLIETR